MQVQYSSKCYCVCLVLFNTHILNDTFFLSTLLPWTFSTGIHLHLFFYSQTQMGTPPSLPVASPLAQPGSASGPGSVSAVGPMGPQSVGGGPNSAVGAPPSSMTPSNTNQQPNSIPHLGAMRVSSPSPAHSRSPTPHQTPPRLSGSQTPQPHTPNAPQLAPPPAPQQNQHGQGPGSNKPLQQHHIGPAGSTTPSHPGLASSSTPHGAQLPRTPVSLILSQKCHQVPLILLI